MTGEDVGFNLFYRLSLHCKILFARKVLQFKDVENRLSSCRAQPRTRNSTGQRLSFLTSWGKRLEHLRVEGPCRSIYNFMCFAKFGKFLFLQLLFQSHVLSSVLGLQWYEWWILLSSHKAWGSANFFSSLFSLHYLDWFILNSLILSLSSPLYYWTHPWVLKFWLLYFWVL